MCIHHANLLGVVLLAQALAGYALAAAVLRVIGGFGQALDIAKVRQRNHHIVAGDQILHVDLTLDGADLGAAVIAELIANLSQLILNNGQQQVLVRQDGVEVSDGLFQLLILGQQLIQFQIGQAGQTHIQNGLRLLVGKLKAGNQLGLGGGHILAVADDVHNLVDAVHSLEQAFQNVCARQALVQVVLGAAGDNVLLVLDIPVQHIAQGKDLGLTMHQRQHDHAEGILQLGVLVQVVEHHLGLHIALKIDDHAHAVAVRFVADIADAVQALFMHKLGNLFYQLGLVYAIGNFGYDDAVAAIGQRFHLGFGAHNDAAAAGMIGLANTAAPQDDAAGGEIRTLDMLHQVVQACVRIIHQADGGVDNLRQVMGRNVGGHAHGDAGGAVNQQIGETAGQHGGLHQRFIKVWHEIDGILVDLANQAQGDLGHARLGITHGRRAVAIDGAEVALPLHQHIAGVEILRQAHHGIVHRGIAVRMILTQHVAHDTRALAERLIGGHAQLVHGVQDTAMNGLEAVAHIGQRAVDNYGHGVGYEALFHLLFQIYRNQAILNITHCLIPFAGSLGKAASLGCGKLRRRQRAQRGRIVQKLSQLGAGKHVVFRRHQISVCLGHAVFVGIKGAQHVIRAAKG